MRLGQSAQVLKTVDSGVVPIAPGRLHRITAHDLESGKLKTALRIIHARLKDISEHIGFSATSRAGAGAAKKLQIQIGFAPVIPLHGQLMSDLLDVLGLQAHGKVNLTRVAISKAISEPGLTGRGLKREGRASSRPINWSAVRGRRSAAPLPF